MSIASGLSDAELLVVLAVDAEAFRVFYDRYFARVTAYAARRCSCAEDVADVVAQTFVQLLSAAGRYDSGRGEPAAFLFGIAGNVVRDLHRSGARRQALTVRLAGRGLLDDDDVERIESAIDAARAAEAISGALGEVPTGERAVLELVAGGRTPSEAAGELGISPGAAWTRLSRARQRLRGLVDDAPRPTSTTDAIDATDRGDDR
jgi:RNA polymerase sigma-70 factor (ECF subfamily)